MQNLVLLSVLYRLAFGDFHVVLTIQGLSDPSLTLYVIHERANGTAQVQSFPASAESSEIIAQDNECIVILARGEKGIAGSGIFRVSTGLLEEEGNMLLSPVITNNLVITDQLERAVLSAGLQWAIDKAFGEVAERAQVL